MDRDVLLRRLERLPIFPLPSVQMFPHALLPLHVFEPRYRALLADALAGDRLFAVAAIRPGADASDPEPPLCDVCGVAEVVAHEPVGDGRSNILLHGVARVRIVDEPARTRAYRVARAVLLEDAYRPGADLATAERAVTALADALAARLPSGGDTLRALVRAHDEPAALADVLGATLVIDPDARQQLLETLDVARRLDVVSRALSSALARFPDRASMN